MGRGTLGCPFFVGKNRHETHPQKLNAFSQRVRASRGEFGEHWAQHSGIREESPPTNSPPRQVWNEENPRGAQGPYSHEANSSKDVNTFSPQGESPHAVDDPTPPWHEAAEIFEPPSAFGKAQPRNQGSSRAHPVGIGCPLVSIPVQVGDSSAPHASHVAEKLGEARSLPTNGTVARSPTAAVREGQAS